MTTTTGTSTKSTPNSALTYRIPALWDCWGYDGPRRRSGGEVIVDAGAYMAACLKRLLGSGTDDKAYARRSLSEVRGVTSLGRGRVKDGKLRRPGGDWIRNQIIYGMIVRAATAWDHDGDGLLRSNRFSEDGTFLKTVLLLPHLKRMGVSTLYMLPVSQVSDLFKKGELGCPYAARNFFAFDPLHHDKLVGRSVGELELEFAILVECAHRLGIRVMIDVAPRTAARDSDWIIDHPDWFYWIDRKFERSYRAPLLPGVEYLNPIPGRLNEVYGVPAVQEHLRKFRFAPNVTHPQKWANFAAAARKKRPANLLKEIREQFGVVTPPGFSDVINDKQPPWSDVTYLRMFMDHPVEANRYLENAKEQPPYVLFDTAKASLFAGRRPNRGLWDALAGIIPFYQQFGVDGARVDMAHALPDTLEAMILREPRRRDPDFCFLAEQLGVENHARVRSAGYNFIIGPSWWMTPRAHEGRVHELLESSHKLRTPVLAAVETPDTPRAVVRRGGTAFARQAAVLNFFMPNSVPFINCGQEVLERQPMNLGLDSVPPGRNALPEDDAFAGKLAFFDRFAMHWMNRGGADMVRLIEWAAQIRRRFEADLVRPASYLPPKLSRNAAKIIATGFNVRDPEAKSRLRSSRRLLLMLMNTELRQGVSTTVTNLPTAWRRPEVLLELKDSKPPRRTKTGLTVDLPPADVKVVLI